MKRLLILFVFASTLFLAVSYIRSLPEDNMGLISMMPYANQELGLRGIAPGEWEETERGNFTRGDSPIDQTSLILASAPDMSMDEAKAFAASQLGLNKLPESLKTYRSPYLLWDLYEIDLYDPVAGTLKLNLAMAESGSMAYAVLVSALARDYEAEAPLHDTVFICAVHALTPLK